MTPPEQELIQFLHDLSGRRERLLQLVGADSGLQAAVVDELTDLGEQLVVADEELRVQQEELDDARRQVDTLNAERAQLFESTADAWVLTDDHGLVLQTTRAANQLTLLPPARVTPRPIATWFEVADRSQVRRMIGRRTATETQVLNRASLRRSDGTTVAVRVVLTRSVGGRGEGTRLRWELTELDRPAPRLRVVEPVVEPAPADPPQPEPMGRDSRLSIGLAGMVSRLAPRQPLAQAWATIVTDTRALIPAADHVGLVLYRRRGPGELAAASDPTATVVDAAQLELGGPATVTLAEDRPSRLDDSRRPNDWPDFSTVALGAGLRSALAVPLTLPSHLTLPEPVLLADHPTLPERPPLADQRIGALTLYARTAGSLGGETELAASLLAAHAAAALIWMNREASLQDALVSRQLIGEAVGVLVERLKLTPAAAFEMLVHRSQNANVKLRELARIVVETGQDPADIGAP